MKSKETKRLPCRAAAGSLIHYQNPLTLLGNFHAVCVVFAILALVIALAETASVNMNIKEDRYPKMPVLGEEGTKGGIPLPGYQKGALIMRVPGDDESLLENNYEGGNESPKYSRATERHYFNLTALEKIMLITSNKTDKGEESLKKPNGDEFHLIGTATFSDEVESDGWGKLEVIASSKHVGFVQGYGMGYLEGYLTFARIYQHFRNIYHHNFRKNPSAAEKILKFLAIQRHWLRKSYLESKDGPLREYSHAMRIALMQFEGLYEGYTARCEELNCPDFMKLTRGELYMLNSDGDLESLLKKFSPGGGLGEFGDSAFSFRMSHTHLPIEEEPFDDESTVNKSKNNATKNRRKPYIPYMSECTAMIKLVVDGDGKYTDLLVGHTTWRSYVAMLRIYKHYHYFIHEGEHSLGPSASLSGSRSNNILTHNSGNAEELKISFSSSPGFLSSKDDFYISSRGLVPLETTISNFREELHQKTLPSGALSWQRAMAANLLAHSGRGWVETFKLNTIGTYSNHWMVVDYNVFERDLYMKKASKLKTEEENTDIPEEGETPPSLVSDADMASFVVIDRAPSSSLSDEVGNADGLLMLFEEIPTFHQQKDHSNQLMQTTYHASYNIPFFKDIYAFTNYDPSFFGEDMDYHKCARAQISAREQSSIRTLEDMKAFMQHNNFELDPLSGGYPDKAIKLQ
eukprot:Nk52_evm9s271 gene=Nk52_evmTU9s271